MKWINATTILALIIGLSFITLRIIQLGIIFAIYKFCQLIWGSLGQVALMGLLGLNIFRIPTAIEVESSDRPIRTRLAILVTIKALYISLFCFLIFVSFSPQNFSQDFIATLETFKRGFFVFTSTYSHYANTRPNSPGCITNESTYTLCNSLVVFNWIWKLVIWPCFNRFFLSLGGTALTTLSFVYRGMTQSVYLVYSQCWKHFHIYWVLGHDEMMLMGSYQTCLQTCIIHIIKEWIPRETFTFVMKMSPILIPISVITTISLCSILNTHAPSLTSSIWASRKPFLKFTVFSTATLLMLDNIERIYYLIVKIGKMNVETMTLNPFFWLQQLTLFGIFVMSVVYLFPQLQRHCLALGAFVVKVTESLICHSVTRQVLSTQSLQPPQTPHPPQPLQSPQLPHSLESLQSHDYHAGVLFLQWYVYVSFLPFFLMFLWAKYRYDVIRELGLLIRPTLLTISSFLQRNIGSFLGRIANNLGRYIKMTVKCTSQSYAKLDDIMAYVQFHVWISLCDIFHKTMACIQTSVIWISDKVKSFRDRANQCISSIAHSDFVNYTRKRMTRMYQGTRHAAYVTASTMSRWFYRILDYAVRIIQIIAEMLYIYLILPIAESFFKFVRYVISCLLMRLAFYKSCLNSCRFRLSIYTRRFYKVIARVVKLIGMLVSDYTTRVYKEAVYVCNVMIFENEYYLLFIDNMQRLGRQLLIIFKAIMEYLYSYLHAGARFIIPYILLRGGFTSINEALIIHSNNNNNNNYYNNYNNNNNNNNNYSNSENTSKADAVGLFLCGWTCILVSIICVIHNLIFTPWGFRNTPRMLVPILDPLYDRLLILHHYLDFGLINVLKAFTFTIWKILWVGLSIIQHLLKTTVDFLSECITRIRAMLYYIIRIIGNIFMPIFSIVCYVARGIWDNPFSSLIFSFMALYISWLAYSKQIDVTHVALMKPFIQWTISISLALQSLKIEMIKYLSFISLYCQAQYNALYNVSIALLPRISHTAVAVGQVTVSWMTPRGLSFCKDPSFAWTVYATQALIGKITWGDYQHHRTPPRQHIVAIRAPMKALFLPLLCLSFVSESVSNYLASWIGQLRVVFVVLYELIAIVSICIEMNRYSTSNTSTPSPPPHGSSSSPINHHVDSGNLAKDYILSLKKHAPLRTFPKDPTDACSVCLSDMGLSQDQQLYLPCGHSFHEECVEQLLISSHNSHRQAHCPECRALLHENQTNIFL